MQAVDYLDNDNIRPHPLNHLAFMKSLAHKSVGSCMSLFDQATLKQCPMPGDNDTFVVSDASDVHINSISSLISSSSLSLSKA